MALLKYFKQVDAKKPIKIDNVLSKPDQHFTSKEKLGLCKVQPNWEYHQQFATLPPSLVKREPFHPALNSTRIPPRQGPRANSKSSGKRMPL